MGGGGSVVFALNRPHPPNFLGPLQTVGMEGVAGVEPRSDCSVTVQRSVGALLPPLFKDVLLLAPSDSGTERFNIVI